MEQRRAFELVGAARGALDLLHELGDVLDVRGRDGAAGVVHEDVDAAVGVDDPRRRSIDGAVVALVAHPSRTVRAAASVCARERGSPARATDDGRACLEQSARDADADAATRSGDDRDLAVERTHPQNDKALNVLLGANSSMS